MQFIRGAVLPILLLTAACGRGPSRAELSDRVAELEDENDTLKQQLGDAQDRLEQRRPKAGHSAAPAKRTASIAAPTATRINANRPAHAARLEREKLLAPPPKPRAQPNEALNAAANALVAASDARKAMLQR